MRMLTPSATAASASAAAEPALVLDLHCGTAGVFRYATRDLPPPLDAAGRIQATESLRSWLRDHEGTSAPLRLTLSAPDDELKAVLEADGLRDAEASLLLHFDDLGESDLVPLVTGRISGDAAWDESAHAITLTLHPQRIRHTDRTLGHIASRTDFPTLGAGEEGRMLPLVYGRPSRVRAVLVRGGAESELVRPVGLSDTAFPVRDASRFPAGTTRIRIHQEELVGAFSGNTFHVTERGAALTSATTTQRTGRATLVRASGLGATDDNAYAGLYLKVNYGGRTQTRRITQYVAATGVLVLAQGIVGSDFQDAILPAGVDFAITTVPGAHPLGAPVHEVLDEYVYLINDAAIESVKTVEGWGVVEPDVVVEGTRIAAEHRGYLTLPPTAFAVNVNDTTTFPDLGRAVATLRLHRLPKDLPESRFLNNDLFVSVRGTCDENGTMLENPADITEHILTTHADVDTSEIDTESFSTTAAARQQVRFDFRLETPRPVGEVLLDLAFQARCALLWESGRVALRPLDNAVGTSSLTLDASTIEWESASLAYTPEADVVTELTARYTHRAERAAVVVNDSAAEAEFGKRAREVTFWAFEQRHQVLDAAEWWLRRWRHRYRVARLNTFLPGVPLERGDTVTLEHAPLCSTPVTGRVIEVQHIPGRPATGEIDRVRLGVQLPLWGGCASSCEHACEATACESSACELSCTVTAQTSCGWSCEVACEAACELSCTLTCELSCQATCMIACRAGGETAGNCATTCEVGCETSCESVACESQCESCCEVNCESASSETISPIREVLVLTPPTTPGGAATVVVSNRAGDTRCESFTAFDPFDVRPAAGAQCTVYLNFNFEWVLVPGPRDVKYVKVTSDAGGGQYEVVEQNHTGDTWGEPFYAWAVDSV